MLSNKFAVQMRCKCGANLEVTDRTARYDLAVMVDKILVYRVF